MPDSQFTANIIIINHENKKANQLADILNSSFYTVSTITAESEISSNLDALSPDIFILDLNAHDMDGVKICQKIRRFSKMPIFVLSTVDQPGMVEHILDAGADDFMLKPTPTRILIARIKTLARRARAEKTAQRLCVQASEHITL